MLDIMTKEFERGSKDPNFGGAYGQAEENDAAALFSIHGLPFQLERSFQKPVKDTYPVVLLPIVRSNALDQRHASQQNLHKSPISSNYEPSRKS